MAKVKSDLEKEMRQRKQLKEALAQLTTNDVAKGLATIDKLVRQGYEPAINSLGEITSYREILDIERKAEMAEMAKQSAAAELTTIGRVVVAEPKPKPSKKTKAPKVDNQRLFSQAVSDYTHALNEAQRASGLARIQGLADKGYMPAKARIQAIKAAGNFPVAGEAIDPNINVVKSAPPSAAILPFVPAMKEQEDPMSATDYAIAASDTNVNKPDVTDKNLSEMLEIAREARKRGDYQTELQILGVVAGAYYSAEHMSAIVEAQLALGLLYSNEKLAVRAGTEVNLDKALHYFEMAARSDYADYLPNGVNSNDLMAYIKILKARMNSNVNPDEELVLTADMAVSNTVEAGPAVASATKKTKTLGDKVMNMGRGLVDLARFIKDDTGYAAQNFAADVAEKSSAVKSFFKKLFSKKEDLSAEQIAETAEFVPDPNFDFAKASAEGDVERAADKKNNSLGARVGRVGANLLASVAQAADTLRKEWKTVATSAVLVGGTKFALLAGAKMAGAPLLLALAPITVTCGIIKGSLQTHNEYKRAVQAVKEVDDLKAVRETSFSDQESVHKNKFTYGEFLRREENRGKLMGNIGSGIFAMATGSAIGLGVSSLITNFLHAPNPYYDSEGNQRYPGDPKNFIKPPAAVDAKGNATVPSADPNLKLDVAPPQGAAAVDPQTGALGAGGVAGADQNASGAASDVRTTGKPDWDLSQQEVRGSLRPEGVPLAQFERMTEVQKLEDVRSMLREAGIDPTEAGRIVDSNVSMVNLSPQDVKDAARVMLEINRDKAIELYNMAAADGNRQAIRDLAQLGHPFKPEVAASSVPTVERVPSVPRPAVVDNTPVPQTPVRMLNTPEQVAAASERMAQARIAEAAAAAERADQYVWPAETRTLADFGDVTNGFDERRLSQDIDSRVIGVANAQVRDFVSVTYNGYQVKVPMCDGESLVGIRHSLFEPQDGKLVLRQELREFALNLGNFERGRAAFDLNQFPRNMSYTFNGQTVTGQGNIISYLTPRVSDCIERIRGYAAFVARAAAQSNPTGQTLAQAQPR